MTIRRRWLVLIIAVLGAALMVSFASGATLGQVMNPGDTWNVSCSTKLTSSNLTAGGVTLACQTAAPALTVTATSTSTNPTPGQPVELRATLHNNTSAGIFSPGVGFYDTTTGQEVSWAAATVTLAAGGDMTFSTATSQYHSAAWVPATAGTYHLIARPGSNGVDGLPGAATFDVVVGSTPTTTTTPPTTTVPPTTTTQPPPSGCAARFYLCSSPWNTPIPSGSRYHDNAALRGNVWWVNSTTFSHPVFFGAATDPVVAVSVPGTWGWPAGVVNVHIPASATASNGSDGSIVIVDQATHTSYDFWIFTRDSATTAHASAYAEDNAVTGTGFGHGSVAAGIRAAGSSGLAGEIFGTELESATGIHHALAIAGQGGEFCADAPGGFIAPAIAGDGACEGVHLAIPAGTPMPAGLSVAGQAIWNALVQYGAYAVDTVGCCSTGVLNADPMSVPGADVSAAFGDLAAIEPYVRVVG